MKIVIAVTIPHRLIYTFSF